MKSYVAAVDCGTSAVKAAVLDLSGRVLGAGRRECPCRYLRDGRIEQSAELLAARTFSGLKDAVQRSGVRPGRIAALAVSNQRATVIPADSHGNATGDAISWQDMRGRRELEALGARLGVKRYHAITGLPLNPVFSLAKILSLKKTAPRRKPARFALVQDHILKRFGAPGHFLDWSNASLTGMFDVEELRWSPEILGLAGVDESHLPTLVASGTKVGAVSAEAARRCGLLAGTPLVSGGGDQQCAGIGAGAVRSGVAELTLGSAGVLLACVDRPRKDPGMRIACCAHAVPGKWVVEGLQNSAGACLDWLSRLVSVGRFSDRFLRAAFAPAPGPRDPMFFPFLAGAGAPLWEPEARAMLLGLTHAHDRAAVARAILEGVSLETKSIIDAFRGIRVPVRELRLTGGGSAIAGWTRLQADLFGIPVATLDNPEASVLGAGILAAWGAGAFASLPEAADAMATVARACRPVPENTRIYARRYALYRHILDRPESGGLLRMMPQGGLP